MEELTIKEIDILIQGLESWETPDLGGEMLLTMFDVMVYGDNPELTEKRKKENTLRMERQKQIMQERKETSTMIKAKLITMKQSLVIKDANTILNSHQNSTKV